MNQPAKHFYEFGSFRLDATEHILLRDGHHIPIAPKVFETLLALVENTGHVTDKDELIKKVWPNTYVEEVNLAKNVSFLRKILGVEQSQHYIETIPKRGYRFVAGVREVWETGNPLVAEGEHQSVEVAEPTDAGTQLAHFPLSSVDATHPEAELTVNGDVARRNKLSISGSSWRWAIAVILPVAMTLAIVWAVWSRPAHTIPSNLVKVVPITSFSGNEDQAAFAPDGKQVAFVWNGEKEDNNDIYVKLIGGDTPLRLTEDPAPETSPAWSPDGQSVAFLRQSANSGGLFLVSSLGGPERKLADVFPYRPVIVGNALSYSPDGKFIVAPDKQTQSEPFSLFLFSVETGEEKKLTSPPAGSVGDLYSGFSPDQKLLAFVRSDSIAAADIYILPFGGGEPKRLTFDHTSIRGLSWTANGREIVFASRRGGSTYNLWKISVEGGTPEQLMTSERDAFSPVISRPENRLAYTQSLVDGNIWQITQNPKGQIEAPTRLISSTQEENGPSYSPDGQRIVFASRRSGSFEIWVCNVDGANPRKLTSIGGPLAGTPRWSPDGKEIVFDSWVEGDPEIYAISIEGGKPRRLTFHKAEDITPSWSRDGKWIYFGSTRDGGMQIWKVPAAGGDAIQVTRQGGFEGFESPDGKYFYYAKGRAMPGIWRIPVGGGEETLVTDHHQAGLWRYWAVSDKGLYFATAEMPSRPVVEFLNFASQKVTQIARLDRSISRTDPGLAVSPDGQTILIAQIDQSGSDIILMESFH